MSPALPEPGPPLPGTAAWERLVLLEGSEGLGQAAWHAGGAKLTRSIPEA